MKHERIPTEEPIRYIWNRFDILTSISGAKKFYERKYERGNINGFDEHILEEKAKGLAFCIRSAKEYFKVPIEGNLTSASLAYYYGTFSLLKALILSSVNNSKTLKEIEKYTRYGHGLTSLSNDKEEFSESEIIMILTNGFFPIYLKEFGYEISQIAVSKRYKEFDEINPQDKNKIITLKDLLSRIPELRSLYLEIFNEQPKYLTCCYPTNKEIKEIEISFPIYKNSMYLSPEDIYDIIPELKNIELEKITLNNQETFKTTDKVKRELIDSKSKYKSVMAYECIVKPLIIIDDILLIDFMFLYMLSIWVRYRPALWREITEGKYDIYKSIVTNFLTVVKRIIPNVVLNRIYDKEFLFAGFSYYS